MSTMAQIERRKHCADCGNYCRKYADRCIKCARIRSEKLYDEAAAIVATGKCPDCGSGLRRNLALTGWWTCEQRGADGFRKDSTKPSCEFQTFTR